MPNNIVKSFSAKSGEGVGQVESHWKKAEGIVQKEYGLRKSDGEKYFKLVTSIVKKIAHIKEYYQPTIGFKKFYHELEEARKSIHDVDDEKPTHVFLNNDEEEDDEDIVEKIEKDIANAEKIETKAEKVVRNRKYSQREPRKEKEKEIENSKLKIEKDKKVESIWEKFRKAFFEVKDKSEAVMNKHSLLGSVTSQMTNLYGTYQDIEREKEQNPQYSKKIFLPLIFNIFGAMSDLFRDFTQYKESEAYRKTKRRQEMDRRFDRMTQTPEFENRYGDPDKFYGYGAFREDAEAGAVAAGTSTGDIAQAPTPLGSTRKKKTPIVTRKPDGQTTLGHPYFDIDDDQQIKKFLDGRNKYERWHKSLNDKGIHSWAKKNGLKTFYVRTKDGVHIKVR